MSRKTAYRIGDFTLLVSMPDGVEYPEPPNLTKFRTKGVYNYNASIRVRIVPGEPQEPQDMVCISRTKYEATYTKAPAERYFRTNRTRVLYREDGKDGILLTAQDQQRKDVNGLPGADVNVIMAEDALDLLGGKLILQLADLPRRVLEAESVFLHASMIEFGGTAILFTAPKQTGKSTQAELWKKYRGARIINGDRALLRRKDGAWYAFGSPYCGTSQYCENAAFPLAAIVYLSQAKENTAESMSLKEAIAAMLKGCTYDPRDGKQIATILSMTSQFDSEIPLIHLACLPNEDAVSCLQRTIWNESMARAGWKIDKTCQSS